MSTTSSEPLAVTLSSEERSFLLKFLEQALHDKKIEEHRTEAFEFREHVQHEIALLQALIDKLSRR
jgi:hypothetical protein